MVTTVSSLGRTGLHDWLIQRVSAVVFASYILVLLLFFICYAPVDFAAWSHLFSMTWMKVFSLLALLSLAAHAWIGLWTVTTDYIDSTTLRIVVQTAVILASVTYVIWGILILWR